MAKDYRPDLDNFIPLVLLVPTTTMVSGVSKKTFPKVEDGILFFGSLKAYGGTDTTKNDLYSVEDTAKINTWYNPSIKSDCRIAVAQNGNVYEIIGPVENVNMRNQFMIFKVRRLAGGA